MRRHEGSEIVVTEGNFVAFEIKLGCSVLPNKWRNPIKHFTSFTFPHFYISETSMALISRQDGLVANPYAPLIDMHNLNTPW